MKKFILFLVLGLLVASCSTEPVEKNDNNPIGEQHSLTMVLQSNRTLDRMATVQKHLYINGVEQPNNVTQINFIQGDEIRFKITYSVPDNIDANASFKVAYTVSGIGNFTKVIEENTVASGSPKSADLLLATSF